MKKLVFALGKADNKTRVLGIVALALAVIAILLVAIPANKAINGPITEIAIIETVIPDQAEDTVKDAVDISLAEIKEELEGAGEDMGELEAMLAEVGIEFNTDEALEKAAQAFGIIIGVIKWYAIALCAFVFFSMIGMNKGFFITATCLSPIFFFLFAGIVLFPIFLGLCIAYSILVGKVKKAYIIYEHEQSKAAEAPVVEEV